MALHPLAGKPTPASALIDLAALVNAYYDTRPDVSDPHQLVSFGTSGHRGTSASGTFNEAHVLAITQALCDYRRVQDHTGPLFVGQDTHALSAAAQRTALEVLAANGVETIVQQEEGFTPTPVISRAILQTNRGRESGFADGIVFTPSHNPPQAGGFKYNPPNGGPAGSDATAWIEERANTILRGKNVEVKRTPYERALQSDNVFEIDFAPGYVRDLFAVIDMDPISHSGLKIGVDPLGGASVDYWAKIAEQYDLNLTVVNEKVDPSFAFMTLDHDGEIRMDCSSPHAMAGLIGLKDKFDIAFATDPDADRHGIVTRSAGLINPNHYLAAAIRYLITHRRVWDRRAKIGKTLVSSGLIDRVAERLGRAVWEVPVGFKWFAPGLYDGSVCFGGEESAGASFLRSDGTVWTTDKDGLLLCLLAAEITAATEKDPGEHYREITAECGESFYTRIDAPATPQQKAHLARLSRDEVKDSTLAGSPIAAILTAAPGNGAPIGGLKVTAEDGWFAARPSGTENLYKLYAESFVSAGHLERIVDDARQIIAHAV